MSESLLPALTDASDPAAVVSAFLRAEAGLIGEMPTTDDGRVDLGELVRALPDRPAAGGDVTPFSVLDDYYQSIAPRRRARGVYLSARHVADVLLERLELLSRLLDAAQIPLCAGLDCGVYATCRYARSGQVDDLTTADGIPCAIGRDIVRHYVKTWTQPQGARPPVVDPQRPEVAFLFQELVRLAVLEDWYGRWIKVGKLLTKTNDKFRDAEGAESREWINEVENPLMAGYIRVQSEIRKVLKDMGLNPEFRIKQGLDDHEITGEDVERRRTELARDTITDELRALQKSLPEGDPERVLLEKVLTAAAEKLS